MNILHISSGTLKSGANKGAYNLHKNLIKKGVKSIFFSPEKIEKKNYNFNNFKYKFSLFFEKLIKLSYMNKTKNSFTSSYFGINIKDTNEYKKADIIHVHNLGKTFVNLNIFKDVNKKFVFSLRDMWFFTGGCHYSLDCKKYIQICNNCPSLNSKFNRDLSYKSQKRKLEIFNNNIYIIAVSYWIKNRFKESKIGNKKNKYDVSVIENIANFENFNINKSGKLFNKLKEHTDDIYLAGDDDQAIFAWAGADVDRFISQKADQEKVLKYSKRISRAVQEQSEIPIEKIEGLRKEKDYYPRDYEGECEYINNLDHVDLTTGRWVILTRTISRLVSMKKELRERNLYYQTKKEKSFKVRVYNAHINYNSWCRGKILDEKEWKDIEEYIGKKMEDWEPDLDWFDAFKEVEYEDKEYIKEMMENGEDLDLPARIFISTIHAFKGGEQDNVILCLDQPNKIKKAVRKSKSKSDEEHRVWYVGITRARNNLYKLKSKKKVNAYKL